MDNSGWSPKFQYTRSKLYKHLETVDYNADIFTTYIASIWCLTFIVILINNMGTNFSLFSEKFDQNIRFLFKLVVRVT